MVIGRKIEEVIDKGAPTKKDNMPIKAFKIVSQKIRMDMFEKIQKAIADRPGMSRSSWVQEAIQEKLKRLEDDIY